MIVEENGQFDCSKSLMRSPVFDGSFVFDQVICSFNNSHLIHFSFLNRPKLIEIGEIVFETNISLDFPQIDVDKHSLHILFYYRNYVIIYVSIKYEEGKSYRNFVHWIYLISNELSQRMDLCLYNRRQRDSFRREPQFLLLYGTNLDQIILQGKTFCQQFYFESQIKEFSRSLQLNLIASTYFYVHKKNYSL